MIELDSAKIYAREMFRNVLDYAAANEIMLTISQDEKLNVEPVDFVTCGETQTFDNQASRVLNKKFLMIKGSIFISLGEAGSWQESVGVRNDLEDIFKYACIDKLAEIFEATTTIFEREGQRMSDYLSAWNDILEDRRPSLFVLTATLSNLGRFDSFVRAKGKVIIGSPGAKDPIEFPVEEEEHDENAPRSGNGRYITVKTRKARPAKFIARLPREKSIRVKAAFESGLVYARLCLLVNSGREEVTIVSPANPFSTEARNQHDEKLNSLKVTI